MSFELSEKEIEKLLASLDRKSQGFWSPEGPLEDYDLNREKVISLCRSALIGKEAIRIVTEMHRINTLWDGDVVESDIESVKLITEKAEELLEALKVGKTYKEYVQEKQKKLLEARFAGRKPKALSAEWMLPAANDVEEEK